MRTHRRIVPLILLVLLAACAATTPLGKVKEVLLYDKEVAVNGYAAAVKLHAAGQLAEDRYQQARTAYTNWQRVHNAAVDAVSAAESLARAGKAWDQAGVASLRADALATFTRLLGLLVEMGVLR